LYIHCNSHTNFHYGKQIWFFCKLIVI
jgi:hypothetical protein